MDVIHTFLNILLLVVSLVLTPLLLPLVLLFKLLRSVVKPFIAENVAGKVVVITGASSGIGEHMAYEYAKRGACLVLVARREDQLQIVADKAKDLGCPDVLVIRADVSKIQDCKNFIDQTISHFDRLDHLVNNAGIAPLHLFEDYSDFDDYASIMNVNFWGSVYSTQFAIPHLKKSKGKIIVITSVSAWYNFPRLSIYGATKAAMVNFFETLRVEVGSNIGITIVCPGFIGTEITDSDYMAQAKARYVPLESVEECARAVVNGSLQGDRYMTEPAWYNVLFLLKLFCPELLDWCTRFILITRSSDHRKTN